MATPTFQAAFDALEGFYASTHDNVQLDTTAGRFAIVSPGVDVQDLAHLIDEVLGLDDPIPDWIPHGLTLVELELQRASSSPGFDFTMSVAATDLGWTVIDGLTIDGATLTFGYGPAGLSGRIAGTLTIDDLELDVSLDLPDQILEAHLRSVEGDRADTGAAFLRRNDLVAPADGVRQPATEPVLDDLSLYAGIRSKRFVVHAQVQHVIDADPFHLEAVEVQVEFGVVTSTAIWADMRLDLNTLGPILIAAAAHVDADGWTFEGRLDATREFTLGHLAADIVAAFGASTIPHLPSVIADATVDHVTVGFDTSTRDYSFECELHWPADDVDVTIALHYADGTITARGTMVIGDLRFDLVFDHSSERTSLVGVFSADGDVHVTLADVIGALGAGSTPMGDLAADFAFGLHDAVLAWESGSKMLFAADLDLGVDLSGLGSLPLVGSMMPKADSLRLTFRPIVSTAWTSEDLAPVGQALPDSVAPLPDHLDADPRIYARLQLGQGEPIDLNLIEIPADRTTGGSTGDARPQPAAASSAPVTAAADAKPGKVEWKQIDRSFGPVRISEVGVHFDKSSKEVELLLSGSISIAGLELTLMGLGARYGLDDQHLDVTLHGIGLELKREPIEIGGAFANVDGDFAGKVIVRTSEFAVTALGAFKMISGAPSMFVYGVLDYPIGGPPFFFVDGLALGFGYNRRFIPPTVDKIREFPLVSDAAGSTTAPASVDEQLRRLHDAVPPAAGEYFVAVGVKFTSFKLLESFVLLVVSFGEHFEIDLIGTATYQTPPGDLGPVPPMARAELDLVGRIVPDEGSILIQAQLSDASYVYNPLCHIYGGFAFASWFAGDHEGDFVLSVGGYHPSFHPPDYYPVPPRIGLKYQITPDIYVKGEGYFALTPSLFMAGAALEASATIGSASATFRVSLDFLIGWEPYHYDARLRIDVAAKWHCFHTSASVDLHIWGPDFAGHGEITWTIFSFDVSFGAVTSRGPIPIGFDRFRDAFLPAAAKACSIRCAAGLVDSVDGVSIDTGSGPRTATVWNINPKELRIETSSVIPEAIANGDRLGIAPMNRSALGSTAQRIAITRDGLPVPTTDLRIEALAAKKYPSALWDTKVGRSLSDKPVTATPGYAISVDQPVHPAATHPMTRADLVASNPIRGFAGDTSWSWGHVPTEHPDDAFQIAHPELPWNTIRHVTSSGGLG